VNNIPQNRRNGHSRVPIPSLAELAKQSEQWLLGSLIQEPERFGEIELSANDFGLPFRGSVFALMAELAEEGRSWDLVILTEEFLKRSQSVAADLAAMLEGLPRRVSLVEHVERIREAAQRRHLDRALDEAKAACWDAVSDPATLRRQLIEKLGTQADSPLAPDDGLKLKGGTDIVEREQHWIIPDFLPDETLVLVAGKPGIGKTSGCSSWAAALSRGRLPVLGTNCEPRNVMILSNEDSEAHLRKLFTEMGGDLSRLWVEDEDSDVPWQLGNLAALEARIVEHQIGLVIIDSLSTHKVSGKDLNSPGDMAPMLVPLRQLANRCRCLIVLIHHENKAKTTDPMEKISGSLAIVACARHAIVIGQHPENQDIRVAAVVKSNLTLPGKANYEFQLVPFQWKGRTELQAGDLLLQPDEGGRPADAEAFLRQALESGPEDAAKLRQLAESGYGIKVWTLQRAATKLEIVRTPSGFGRGRQVLWALPSIAPSIAHQRHSPKIAIDGAEPIKTALFDAGPTIDCKNTGSVIDGAIDGAIDGRLDERGRLVIDPSSLPPLRSKKEAP